MIADNLSRELRVWNRTSPPLPVLRISELLEIEAGLELEVLESAG